MADTRWKAFERRVAQLLGTRRIPVTGERAGADAETSLFCFQFKKRACVPGYLREWLDSIRGCAVTRGRGQIGVVVMQIPGAQDLDALVVMSLRDWLELHGPCRSAEERERVIAEIAERAAHGERVPRQVPPEAAVHGDEVRPRPSTAGQRSP